MRIMIYFKIIWLIFKQHNKTTTTATTKTSFFKLGFLDLNSIDYYKDSKCLPKPKVYRV